ncbi:uncharacterized protein [Antedon mediterranea]|uniref:uncharacterized protein n=1 Tax=Antedon mediterranea TaxID=105859 RepID=UPI003AF694DB
MYVRNISVALTVFLYTIAGISFVSSGSCKDVSKCPLPNGLTNSGFANGVVTPWPPDNGATREPCLPSGKKYMKFTCNEGFRLQAAKIELSCDKMYNWNLDAPTCIKDLPPPPPTCNDPFCTDISSASESYLTDGATLRSNADEALVMVIIVLAVLLLMSWVIFLFALFCKRKKPIGRTVHETVYVHGEPRQQVVKGSNDVQLSTRPPIPMPRQQQTTLEYDYVQTSTIMPRGTVVDTNDYLQPM